MSLTIAICNASSNSNLHVALYSNLLFNIRMITSKDIRLANLRILKEESGTVTALARKADTSPAHLGQILNGVRNMGDALARKIEANLGRPVGWMDRMSEEMRAASEREIDDLLAMSGGRAVRYEEYASDMYLIPTVRLRLSAGVTGFQTEPEPNDGSRVGVPKKWADQNSYRPQHLIALSIRGESMEPSLYAGDQVIVNTADTRMEDGAVYAFNYEGEAVIKRLRRDMGQWLLASDNPDQRRYHPKNCRDGECMIVGRVVRRETSHI